MINSLYMPSLSLPSFALGQGIRKWMLAVASVVSSRKQSEATDWLSRILSGKMIHLFIGYVSIIPVLKRNIRI